MENIEQTATFYKIVIGVVLLAFWWFGSMALTTDPSLAVVIIPVSLGMLTAIAVVIQLALRESVQAKMKELLDSEIEERREELTKELKDLVSYLEQTKYPSYSDCGVRGLEDDFQEFDSIKSKYTFEPKIIRSTIFVILSSLILVLFLANPALWVHTTESDDIFTLAHVGLGLLGIGLWTLLSILVTSLEVKTWEQE